MLQLARNYCSGSATVQPWWLLTSSLVQLQHGQLRQLASTATSPAAGFIEIREYTLKPEGFKQFVDLVNQYADVRKKLLPYLGMFTCDTGGTLHKVTHFYHYKDLDERDMIRDAAYKNDQWKEFILKGRPFVQHQESKIMLEAKPIYDALKLGSTGLYTSPGNPQKTKVVYEMRNYQLHPGYGSVPKLVEAFSKGLPHKVQSDPDGQLVFFGYTDVGMLNNVVELWRYPSAQACIRARQSARTVQPWRDTIAAITPGVQHFTSSFLHPVATSPWQ